MIDSTWIDVPKTIIDVRFDRFGTGATRGTGVTHETGGTGVTKVDRVIRVTDVTGGTDVARVTGVTRVVRVARVTGVAIVAGVTGVVIGAGVTGGIPGVPHLVGRPPPAPAPPAYAAASAESYARCSSGQFELAEVPCVWDRDAPAFYVLVAETGPGAVSFDRCRSEDGPAPCIWDTTRGDGTAGPGVRRFVVIRD